ncbi:TMAO reductase system periplasmic protein TorT [Salipiger sp. P9]|uniref:TMAO reductase system periplasmic protein TorT n=1 Tax=Salipiger pentaromativorans TaxID=2943193 RepID=UPI002158197C|nr:TMAO reductase system periplasmic protein TorT [Salipiger pentaromativorans]MCR8548941.1 TMAO reductase system periplasmic protein TorT [Salipiger pentaromativorans]
MTLRLSPFARGLTAAASTALFAGSLWAEEPWWPAEVNPYSLSCTDGSDACWADPANNPAALPVAEYVPLSPDEVTKKWNICVAFPHLKDSYWVGIGYGVISEGKRLGQKISLFEAGGYTNLERQLRQVEDCVNAGADAVVLSAISGKGNANQVDEIRAQGIPVIDLVNGVGTQVDAKILESWYLLGYLACNWVAQKHPEGSGKVSAAWFPGPPGAAWSVAGDQGCMAGVEGSDVELIATKWGDTGKSIQLKLVEDVVASRSSGSEVDLQYIIGSTPTIEAAVGVVRDRGISDSTQLVSYYYNTGVDLLMKQGRMAMAPSDQMVLQGRIAIDQAVRLLEKKEMATGGAPEYGNTERITEHVQPLPLVVTRDSYAEFDSGSTLAPAGWTPEFSVD